ncbi:MAG: hypothetical protein HOI56_01400 [Gammaproteobacteria bacterium]|jgi:hypothetical protein|nr:hypothetical protein [Gammaproteobacteria bacterium]MBT4655393.1 hypothetical protein [Gammaproteobacteria bacterium]MBT5761382.1 hypothetical protein [Gammaproteobacteria bacterium]MBT6331948.1 hypothetical protein [Gammaproteobacteria bacterium]MBT7933025.1 hypothetical protein [Gammaproteobacteria bacterium]
MKEILIHKSDNYIEEDRDYYCSDIRDKHGMIQPSDNLVSVTCDSKVFKSNPTNDQICSIYYPFEKGSFHRIYVGISFPLFANNWGAAFLRHLMYLIEPEGGVILPVYAERQGVEKNYWSRSSLEVTFQSRQKWWGMSNIWAENDGVMSMRIGKKQPPKKNSSLNHFLENISSSDSNIGDVIKHHTNGIISAIVEQIIINYFGRTKAVSFCDIGGDGLLSSEILMSDYVNVTKSTEIISEGVDVNNIKKYLPSNLKNKLNINSYKSNQVEFNDQYDVISMVNIFDQISDKEKINFIIQAYDGLNNNGILVIKDKSFNNIKFTQDLFNNLSDNLEHSQYSSIVATKHNEKKNIAHYSDIIFNELKSENSTRNDVINVLQKK